MLKYKPLLFSILFIWIGFETAETTMMSAKAEIIYSNYSYATNNLEVRTTQLTQEEEDLLANLKKLFLARGLGSANQKSDYTFHPKWAVKNQVPYIEKIEGTIGYEDQNKYLINLFDGLSYRIENTKDASECFEKPEQLRLLANLPNRVFNKLNEAKIPTDEKLIIKIEPIDENPLSNESINDLRSRLWQAIWKTHRGTVPEIKIGWRYTHEGESAKLTLAKLSGAVENQKFSIEFLHEKNGFLLSLHGNENKEVFGLSENLPNSQNKSPPRRNARSITSYTCESMPNTHSGSADVFGSEIDQVHFERVTQFIEKLIQKIEDLK